MENKRVIPVVLFCLSLTAAGAVGASDYLNDARDYFEKGELNAAVIQLKNALQEDPSSIDARLLLGKVYLKVGDGVSAEKEISRAAALKAPKERWQGELGEAYLLQGKYAEVLRDIEPDPTLPGGFQSTVMVLRGRAHLGMRNIGEAKASFEKALASMPENEDAKLGLIRVSIAEGRLEEGLTMLDSFVGLYPKNVQGLILHAEMLRRNNKKDQALQEFGRALAIEPENLPALLGRVTILLQQGNYDPAASDLATLDKLAANNPLVTYLHGIYEFQKKNMDQAEIYIRQVLEKLPNHPQSQLIFGAIMYTKGELSQANEYLTRAASVLPGHLPSQKLLAATRLKLREPRKAVEVLEPAMERFPNDPQLMVMLGNAYLQVGRYEEGSGLLSKAVEIEPNLATLRTQLAFGLLAQGDTSKAIDELQSAVDLGQDLIQADVLLVLSHLKNKETEQALKASQALEERMPDNPLAFNLTGLAYLASGEEAKAQERFRKALEISPDFVTAEINLARIELSHQRFDQAEAHFKSVLERSPSNLAALMGMAGLDERRGNIESSYAWLIRAQEKNPNSSRPGVILTQLYLKHGEKLKALRTASETVSKFPDQPLVLQSLGNAQMAAGESNSAVNSFRRLNELQETPHNLLLLAVAQKAAGDDIGSEGSFNKVLALDPENLQAMSSLGGISLDKQNYDESLRIAAQLQERHPDRSVGYELEGANLLAQGEIAKATEVFSKAYQIQPTSKTALQLAKLYALSRKPESAIAQLEDWLQKTPDDLQIRAIYATQLQENGRVDEAAVQYESILEKVPNNLLVLNNLAWIYQQRGDQRALALAENAFALAPQRPEIADTYGWVLVNFKQTEKAIGILREAFSRAPTNPEIGYHLGVALTQAGNNSEAKPLLERLARDFPNSPYAKQAQDLANSLR
ncbi:MAG: PEP-CTERM system TPR-repeat protein PrsT [Gammaproteobacteria bacterium]|nr:PEP-CTERM system TPR-repeat protein PrsT [Gammaproteobacteria bacterium]